ncbi:MAG: NAD-dependent epimerase/dehydratase family protein [Alphaproteobacteria bacterium]|nr:NAD-dependent epimerase/dehydratase family protein [Alphaproteobacteria bacterium]
MAILITGAAGFIGFHLSRSLLDDGEPVIGVDSLNSYYDVQLKRDRLALLQSYPSFEFLHLDLGDGPTAVSSLLGRMRGVSTIVHLAAQAGVRHSIDAPFDYVAANLTGMLAVLEVARNAPELEHLIYASSSSVYGYNREMPFSVDQRTDAPRSFYGATKKSNEVMAHSYAGLYGIPTTGFRFFTVYGAWGRPDMAYFLFTKAIFEGRPVRLFNRGEMRRDFTYIDDIVAGLRASLGQPPLPDKAGVPHAIYNLGNNRSERLMDFLSVLEESIGRKAVVEYAPMQPGDVEATWADIGATQSAFGFSPSTGIAEGLPRFVEWYRTYFRPD